MQRTVKTRFFWACLSRCFPDGFRIFKGHRYLPCRSLIPTQFGYKRAISQLVRISGVQSLLFWETTFVSRLSGNLPAYNAPHAHGYRYAHVCKNSSFVYSSKSS